MNDILMKKVKNEQIVRRLISRLIVEDKKNNFRMQMHLGRILSPKIFAAHFNWCNYEDNFSRVIIHKNCRINNYKTSKNTL